MFKRALQNSELLTFVFAFTDDNVDVIKKNLNLNQLPNNLKILSPRDFEDTINIENAKPGIKDQEVKELMEKILDKELIKNKGIKLVAIKDANFIETEKTEFNLEDIQVQ